MRTIFGPSTITAPFSMTSLAIDHARRAMTIGSARGVAEEEREEEVFHQDSLRLSS